MARRRWCSYCGRETRGRACPAHSDLLKLDPMQIIRHPYFVVATVYAPRLRRAAA